MTSGNEYKQSVFYSYHHQTKHTLQKLMGDHRTLDWANQPDPFRRYEGASLLDLPPVSTVRDLSLGSALHSINSSVSDASALDLDSISTLLYYSMAISNWKQIVGTQHRWALRVNPSSGNLHPTETHLLLRGLSGIDDGAYHYYVKSHALELRSSGNVANEVWSCLTNSAAPPVVIVLSTIFWREAWKYQQRAYRYCHHDMGHALAAILLAAAALGWRSEVFAEFADDQIRALMGFENGDENPLLIIGLRPTALVESGNAAPTKPTVAGTTAESAFAGRPNQLSNEIIHYPIIDKVHAATLLSTNQLASRRQPLPARIPVVESCDSPVALNEPSALSANADEIVRRRRSAVDMDGRQRMTKSDLAAILIASTSGFSSDFQRPLDGYLVELYLYIHRVDGITPGIYFWNRQEQQLLPLVLADERAAAKYVSCFQDIAADGCLAISMIADFKKGYELFGERAYRYVHFEAGFMGQLLYLSGQALGYDSTGIGCFIDDDVNKLLGLADGNEVVYNFTIGKGVYDPRLTSLPAYDFPDPTLG
jgi:SagB-type dehydrogenase family enzyme